MKHRFTYKEPSGAWGVHGEEFRNMSQTIYGAMCKLLDYEETGLSPDDVEEIQYQLEQVHIGQKIDGYEVFGMFNGCCIAFNKKAPDPYVVWTIDDDKCGVHNGRYRSTKEEAVSVFAEYAFGIALNETHEETEPDTDEVWENAPEISEDVFESVITQLYNLLQCMPKNSVRRHFKDVKISIYDKKLFGSFMTDRPCIQDYFRRQRHKS